MTRRRLWIAVGPLVAAAFVVTWVLVGPQPQPLSYHDFADRRAWLGVPNFGDVVSNLGLVLVGLQGVVVLSRRSHAPFVRGWEAWAHWIFAVGVFLTGFGSAYYHWAPDNQTLVWDRLPMTLFFMPFFALMLGERVSLELGRKLLWPLVVVGVGSVVWWAWTESVGRGDLRPYALVQFVPVVAVPALLLIRKPLYTRTSDLLLAVGWYGLAKVLEAADRPVFAVSGELVSGHTLKHVASAVAAWYIVRNLRLRERVSGEGVLATA